MKIFSLGEESKPNVTLKNQSLGGLSSEIPVSSTMSCLFQRQSLTMLSFTEDFMGGHMDFCPRLPPISHLLLVRCWVHPNRDPSLVFFFFLIYLLINRDPFPLSDENDMMRLIAGGSPSNQKQRRLQSIQATITNGITEESLRKEDILWVLEFKNPWIRKMENFPQVENFNFLP